MDDANLISGYFPNLSSQQLHQFARLGPLYREWNARINVISRKDIELLYERHVLHSLGIAKVISFAAGTSVLDIGTGGGLPGIPLAILFPEVRFHLVDSTGKKIKVVEEVVKALGLKNVKAEQARVEEMKGKYDFVLNRAVAEFPKLYDWVKNKFLPENRNEMPNGILCLKGGELGEELEPFEGRVQVFYLKKYFKEEFFETKKVVYMAV